MGEIVAQLGRVHAASQESLKLMEKMLDEDGERLDKNPDEAALTQRHKEWSDWWHTQKAERNRLWLKARERYLSGSKRRKPEE